MNCLLCYKTLPAKETDYHLTCIQKTFGLKQMLLVDIEEHKLAEYARTMIAAEIAITGVQPKLSLWLEKSKENIRFTIVSHKSNYIIKPQSETYTALPENEDVCMHLASAFGIETAIHGLVRLKGGSLAYITKRFDRDKEEKIACEDLCQLTETLTEHKYRGSYEKIGKTIRQYSSQTGFDALAFFERIVFCFITGNADMHLKNFMMWEKAAGQFVLSPACDLVSTLLTIKGETEQMALTINGRKNKISRSDFDALAIDLQLTIRQTESVYQSFLKKQPTALWWVENSFLPTEQKLQLTQLIDAGIKFFAR